MEEGDIESDHDRLSDNLAFVTCPTCFEEFGVARLPSEECPAQLDYDCEVCCRPLILSYDKEGFPQGLGMDDSY